MIKYTSNETYERDKAALINALQQYINDTFSIDAADVVDTLNLLSQSKWIGNDGDPKIESVRPIPVVCDKYGRLIKDYTIRNWFNKLNEVLDELKAPANYCSAHHSDLTLFIAEELQELITLCTSMQQWLGFDQAARDKLTQHFNEKNRLHRYF